MANSKEHIIQIASLLFLQKNFKEVTMKEIVDQTGLSKGAFYHYFKSKEQLFEEVFTFFFASVSHNYEKYSKDSFKQFYNDYVYDTIQLTRKYLDRFAEKMDEISLTLNYFNLIFDAMKISSVVKEKVIAEFDRELDHWEAAVKRARQSGEIRTTFSDREVAQIFMYLSDGIGMHMIMRGVDVENMVKPFKELWDKFYDSIKA